MDFTRYAVYYAPEPGPLADFCAHWLGWDAATGQPLAHPDIPGLPLPVEDITRAPRKYGFHATIKPPFRPVPGTSLQSLQDDLDNLCRSTGTVTLEALCLTRLGGFLALVPRGDTTTLSRLAARALRELDHHRAPLTEAELVRRRVKNLGPAQDKNLRLWGYPHVLEEFRFHMTLTGRLARGQSETVKHALTPHLAPILPEPFEINGLCVFGEATDGRFHLLSRHVLCG